jgi:hypothetical protein
MCAGSSLATRRAPPMPLQPSAAVHDGPHYPPSSRLQVGSPALLSCGWGIQGNPVRHLSIIILAMTIYLAAYRLWSQGQHLSFSMRLRYPIARLLSAGIASTLLLSLFAPLQAFPADDLVVGRLPPQRCGYNLDVDAPKHAGDDSVFADDCVLAFTHPNEHDSEGKDAVIRLNGDDVALRLTRKTARFPNAHYELSDVTGRIKVTMDVRENCPEGVEGCDFTGFMRVDSTKGNALVRVVYYRGG